jgi:hypothetical protein
MVFRSLLFLSVMNIISFTAKAGNTDLAGLLPPASNGWEMQGNDQYYSKEALYSYIDGGAELYISYGYREMIHREYIRPDQPGITIDLFDMVTSDNAYGIFTQSKEKFDTSYGQGAIVLEGAILFWQDRYFISLVADYETPESAIALDTMAQAVSKAIGREGPLPAVVQSIPKENLARESIIYFHHYIWVNAYQFIADTNVFHITENDHCVIARYEKDDERWYLLTIDYADTKVAKTAFQAYWMIKEIHKVRNPNLLKNNDKWIAGQYYKGRLAFIFDAPDEQVARDMLIKTIKSKTGKSKDNGK